MPDDDQVVPEDLRPDDGERGLLVDPTDLERRIVRAWQLFAAGLESVDLAGPSRDRGRSAKEQVIPLGAWPDSRGIEQMELDARAGATEVEPHRKASARLRRSHADASDAEVRDAVHRSGQQVAQWFRSGRVEEHGHRITPSALGPLPLATFAHAASFQLAAVWRDLTEAPASPELEALGLTALVDSAGAVAARLDASASITAITPVVTVGTGTGSGAWRTRPLPADSAGPGVIGEAGHLIDVAAGRVDLLALVRGVRVQDSRRLAAMAVVLDGIPDLPAAAVLRRVGRMAALMNR